MALVAFLDAGGEDKVAFGPPVSTRGLFRGKLRKSGGIPLDVRISVLLRTEHNGRYHDLQDDAVFARVS